MTSGPPTRDSFARTVFQGVGWSYLAFVSNRLITFISTVVLARLLAPEDFGLMAIAMLVIRYFDAINDAGVGPALVQEKADPARTVPVAFAISAATSILLALLVYMSAPALARFFDQPEVADLLRFLSPLFIVGAFTSVYSYWMQKNFRFGLRIIPETAKGLVKAVAAISLALAGFGVWSLAVGQVLGQICAALIYWYLSDLSLRFAFDRSVAIRLVSFGAQISFVTLTGILSKSLDQLVIGASLAPADLGYYVLGAMIPELIIASICYSASQVFFPAFSRVSTDFAWLKSSYLGGLKYLTMLTIPAGAGLALIAADLVDIAYSSDWAPSIPVIWILSINAAVQSTAFTAGDLFKATGRAHFLIRLSLLNIAISTPMLLLGTRYGIVGVAIAQSLGTAVIVIVTIGLVLRPLRISAGHFLHTIGRTILATVIMTAGCAAVLFMTEGLESFARLPLTVGAGLLLYAGAIWMLDEEAASAILANLRRKE